jgi:hypothetical protein
MVSLTCIWFEAGHTSRYGYRITAERCSSGSANTWKVEFVNRFGHSLIRPMLTRMSSQFKEMDSHIRFITKYFYFLFFLDAIFLDLHEFITPDITDEIFSPPAGSVPQTIVVRYKEIGGILCTKKRIKGLVPEKIFFRWKQYYFFDFSCTIYPRFPCSGSL